MSTPDLNSSKRKALKELNADTRNVQVALNQAASALSHAQRLLEDTYQRKRTQIINTPDESNDTYSLAG